MPQNIAVDHGGITQEDGRDEGDKTGRMKQLNNVLRCRTRPKASAKSILNNAIKAPAAGTLRLSMVQVNTLTYEKLVTIIALWKSEKFDYLAITDTRCKKAELAPLNNLLKRLNPGDSFWFSGVLEQRMAGGILIIQSARMGRRCNYYDEGDGKGIYYSNTYNCGEEIITIATTYWPYDKNENLPEGVGSLRARIKLRQNETKSHISPKDFITEVCSKGALQAQKKGHCYILMGDFNQSYEMSYSGGNTKGIELWTTANGLHHAHSTLNLPKIHTFYKDMGKQTGGKELDHALINDKMRSILREAYIGGNDLWASGE